ncbi:hypothetical protein BIFPSEUDO_03328 [Bifidobacterium pseudocatenulatum DSM 20438 = JCM 1200 = LMG 10505]|uniref:Uncharacterized protein n=1 Tax=Bifidobacterium pseudocatenulatum DSM 20438 = JCM 1200 = LMG 10505 TaxID=547043 RepID=C0BRR4_BIFPS|nr:hypothetical protein BIFPSEUDO_03328 [Bifidobacterium pseudocatenulatum DSM 20438 = JCM 1200 = LMG 10505]
MYLSLALPAFASCHALSWRPRPTGFDVNHKPVGYLPAQAIA